MSDSVPIDSAAASVDAGMLLMQPAKALDFGTVIGCGEQEIVIGAGGPSMQVAAGDETFELCPAPAASGAKYEAPGAPGTTFWDKGDRAQMPAHGRECPECRKTGEQGAFRATGNEPAWRLDIGSGEMSRLTGHGQRRFVAPTPRPEKTAEFTRHAASAAGRYLTVTIRERCCADTMTGMLCRHAVSVQFDDRTLAGCGGEPASLLQRREWVVEDLNRGGLIDRSRMTLNFRVDGRVAGRASCNDYTGDYALTGEGLTVSRLAGMMRACAPSLMQQEDRFLDLLKDRRRFELTATDALVLRAGDGRTITARHT